MNIDFLAQKKKYKWKHRLKTACVILLSPVIMIVGILYVVFVLWTIVGYDFTMSICSSKKDSEAKAKSSLGGG